MGDVGLVVAQHPRGLGKILILRHIIEDLVVFPVHIHGHLPQKRKSREEEKRIREKKNAIAAAEKAIATAEEEAAEMEAQLADPATYQDAEKAAQLAKAYQLKKDEIERRYAEWEALSAEE